MGRILSTSTEPPALASLIQPYSPLALRVRRVTGSVVGRPVELAAIQQELASAESGRLAAITLEGEPGIGKTRLLLAAGELASARGFTTIAVAADEELRGPFLLARSIVGSPDAIEAATGDPAAAALSRSMDALSGRDDPSLDTLQPDQKLLRTFDLAAIAIRSLGARRPLALLIDDFQWADEDSLRLLRYIVRADAASPLFLMMTIRPEELAFVNEAVTLLADMERLGMGRRFKLSRFTKVETAEFLRQVLGGGLQASGAAAMHAQAEGVPFIVEEVAHAYRDAGMLQEIDGVWSLAKNAERLVPSAGRTLISSGAARLADETKGALSAAAGRGRACSLKDLREIGLRVDDTEPHLESLAQALAPAVSTGLLVQHPEGSAADYSFAHDQVREFAAGLLTPTRRRAIHAAVVALLMAGDPAAESLPLLAHHARAAGDAPICVRFSIQATRNALTARAPEEVLRVVELALPCAPAAQDRVALLQARDEALDMLRRPEDRLEGQARGARGMSRAGAGSPSHDCRRGFHCVAPRCRSGRSRGSLRAGSRAGRRLWRTGPDGRDQPRARRDRYQPRARLVRRTDPGGRTLRAPCSSRLGGAAGPDHQGDAGGPLGAGCRRPLAAGAGAVRKGGRSSWSDVHDHRDGLPELGAGHPSRTWGRPPHRGDPSALVAHGVSHQGERARAGRRTDAVWLAGLRSGQGHPRPRPVPGRGHLPTCACDRRPSAGVRRRRWGGHGGHRSRRGRPGPDVARSCGRCGGRGPHTAPCPAAGKLARHGPSSSRRCGGHAQTLGARGPARYRAGPTGSPVRGTCPARRRDLTAGGEAGRRGAAGSGRAIG